MTQTCSKAELHKSRHHFVRILPADWPRLTICRLVEAGMSYFVGPNGRPELECRISSAQMAGRSWNVVFRKPKWPAGAGMSYFVGPNGRPELECYISKAQIAGPNGRPELGNDQDGY